MKACVFLCLALLLPALCRGAGISLADAPDWQPLSDAQKAAFIQKLGSNKLHLIDASQNPNHCMATTLATDTGVPVNAIFIESEIAGYIHGVTATGPKLLDRQPASVASLTGVSVAFQGQSGGRDMFILGYELFTTKEVYAVTFYTPTALARTDPMVTSYLSRIKLDSSVVPNDAATSGGLSSGASKLLTNLSSYQLGKLTGTGMVVLLAAAVLIVLILKFVG